MAAKKRAISNFVSIVTSKQIPVKFALHGDSYTDGNTVVISSKLDKNEDFDVAVGLALHEGSHIKLSSFDLLADLDYYIDDLDIVTYFPGGNQKATASAQIKFRIIEPYGFSFLHDLIHL
jgi:hypothetical protein